MTVGIYLTCTTAISTLAMLATVLVANLHNTRDIPVPGWLRTLFFVYVDRLLRLRRLRHRSPSGAGNQVHVGINGEQNENGNACTADRKFDRYRVVTLLNPLAFKTHDDCNDDEGRLTRTHEGQWTGEGGRFDFQSAFPPSSGAAAAEEMDSRANYNRDWVEVAAVCDRFFFWLCLIFIVITTFILLHPLVTLKLFRASPTSAAAAANDNE